MPCEILGLFEIPQILDVHDYGYWMFHAREIVMPFLECLDYHKKLPIIDVIILFYWREGGRVVGTGVEVSIHIFLHQYSSSCGEGGICHDKEGFGGVWHLDYQGREECFLQFDECFVLFFSP